MKCNCPHCSFRWFEGGFLQRLVQFVCYVIAALLIIALFNALGLLEI